MTRLSAWNGGQAFDLLDAIYDLEAPEPSWLERLAAASGPARDDTWGLQAFTFRLDVAGTVFSEPVLVGGTEAWGEMWRENWWEPIILALEPAAFEALVRFGPASVTSALFVAVQQSVPSFRELLEARGSEGWGELLPVAAPGVHPSRLYYPDSWNVVGLDVSGRGVALVANRNERLRDVATEHLDLAERIGAHLAAAVRLRARREQSPSDDHGEAVLEPSGKLVHAEGAARDATTRECLRDAVVAIDRLRAGRGPSSEVLATWRALYEGRYTLVDQFERDGRRFMVARPNEPTPNEPSDFEMLSSRERQVVAIAATGAANKVVAYELGIATSTVAELLRRAARKLGVSSRAELIRRATELSSEKRTGSGGAPG